MTHCFRYFSYLYPAVVAAGKAGEAILEVYDSEFAVEHKDDKSPLTEADRRAHKVIAGLLSEQTGIPLLSEEGKEIPYDVRKGWESFWMVDPLDGTKEFIRRNGEFTVNIALIHKNRPALGVVYVPVKDVFYFGAEGMGSYRLAGSDKLKLLKSGSAKEFDEGVLKETLDGLLKNSGSLLPNHSTTLPLNNSDTKQLDHLTVRPFTVVASRSHMSEETAKYIAGLKEKHGEVELISAGSSLKLCLVAEGRADAYPRFAPTMEWDTAAGQAIVEQAGGKVLDAGTHMPLRYNKENLLNPWFLAEKNPAWSLSRRK